MSEEPSLQTVEKLADYSNNDIELYYHFWVIPNTTSWYQPVEENEPKTGRKTSQNKFFSPLSVILLISSFVLLGMAFSTLECPQKSPSSQQQINVTN